MLLHALGLAIMVAMLSVSSKGMTSMQEQSNSKELLDREIRAPFNGMRGKKDDTDEKMVYRQLLIKRSPFNGIRVKRSPFNSMRGTRAPFNGMRGKRAPFNGMRGKRAPFNGMRGKRAPFNGMRGKRAPFNGMRGKRGGEEEVQYKGDRRGLKVSEISFKQPI